MKRQFPIWQITFPLCGVLIFAIGTFTTIYMLNGRYFFHLEVTSQGMKITTDVDKREGNKLEKVQEKQEVSKTSK